jgi:hypothetical protein
MLGPSSRESVPLLEVLIEKHGLRFACKQYHGTMGREHC